MIGGGRHRCAVCGGSLGARWTVDHFGEATCTACSGGERCASCGAVTGGTGPRQRSELPDGRVRCGRCSRGAVDAQSDVGAVVWLVRPLLHSWGIRLPNRVRVRLTSSTTITARVGRNFQGLTVTQWAPERATQVVELLIVDGLPATQFGKVLAHEMGHGWLATCPTPAAGRSDSEEEGICELLGSWWLEHRGGPLAAHLLNSMETNPDPLYGQGFREMRDRCGGLTRHEVVARLQRTGRL